MVATNPKDMRSSPRLVARDLVSVQLSGRDQLDEVWTTNVSTGGLFVETKDAPALRSEVKVCLSTPDGQFSLSAEVVHVITPEASSQMGHPAGVGLQFQTVDEQTKRLVADYISGIRERLGSAKNAKGDEDAATIVSNGAKVMAALEQADLYGALGIAPLASTDDITQALEKTMSALQTPAAQVTPPQAARLQAIARRLKRGCTHLLNRSLRLRYDFKQGHIRAEARVEDAAGDPKALAELRSAWSHCNPQQVDKAATLARQALDADRDGKLQEAVSIGQKALDLDPFNRELRVAVSLWSARTRKPEKGLHRGPKKINIEGMVF